MNHVDVMVPCYNYSRFLRQCVDSVLTQSHRELRVVIVDDASTDDTPAMCAELAAQDARVTIVRYEANRGHIETYNECIDMAGNDYMLILSADDMLLPGALARAVAVLDAHPEVGLVHGAWRDYRTGDELPEQDASVRDADLLDSAWLVGRLGVGNYVGTATAVVRSAVQKKLGHYRIDLPHSGDLEMWLRFALRSKVAYIHQLQAAYRRHDTNMSLGYQGHADFQQCADALALHYAEIRRSLPGGALIEARIRRRFARKERRFARKLLWRGDLRKGWRLMARSFREAAAVELLWLRTHLGLQPLTSYQGSRHAD